jgi:predicted AAA+ superfamily ATPase
MAWPDLIARDTSIREHNVKASVVLGMRRVGKTSLCRQKMRELEEQGISRRACCISISKTNASSLRAEHFQQLLDVYFRMYPETSSGVYYLFLDEPQRIVGWELFVRPVAG